MPLVPPKPKELLTTVSTFIDAGRVRHVVEVAALARIVEVDRRRRDLVADCEHAEDAFDHAGRPSRCPVIDLVELTASFAACAPKAFLIAVVSATSPSGVEVAWAFTYWTSSGLMAASRRLFSIDSRGAGAVVRRRGDVEGVAAHAEADQLRVDARAALLRVTRIPRAP